MTGERILIVDDESPVRRLLRNCLETEGYEVDEANSADAFCAALKRTEFDLITLDVRLGTENGLDLLKIARAESQAFVVLITGKDDVFDKVLGLELGADDYITKPFHVREVQARVRALFRRPVKQSDTATAPPGAIYQFDGWTLDLGRVELTGRNEQPCDLTTADIKLISVFVQHPKRVLSRERLMDLISGQEWTPLDRTIDNQVARLRRKIEENPSEPRLIKTVRGIGYIFTPDVSES